MIAPAVGVENGFVSCVFWVLVRKVAIPSLMKNRPATNSQAQITAPRTFGVSIPVYPYMVTVLIKYHVPGTNGR